MADSLSFSIGLESNGGGWSWQHLELGEGSLMTDQFDSNPEAVQIFPRG